MGRVMSLFPGIDDHWVLNCMAAGLSSGEGLIWAVRDPIEKTTPTKEKGLIKGYQTVVDDPGVTDKRLLVVESEFAQALRVLGREGNTLSAIIRQAWDKGSLRALTKNNSAQATDTHVSILGHITKPELTKYLGDTDCFNGFANRFLWLLVKRSKFLPDGGENIDLQPLQAHLKQAIAVARQVTTIGRSPDARTLWRRVYQDLATEKHGLYGAVTGRAEAQTLRLSMLYALLDGSAVIEEAHLRAALALWRYSDDSARLIFNQGNAEAEDPMEKQLLGLIRQAPGINRKGLHKALGGHVPAKTLVEALAKLRDRRRIRAEMLATGGRPGECWFPCDLPEATHVSIIGAEADERTNKVDVGVGFELPSLARTGPTDTATRESSIVRTALAVVNVAEVLPPAEEVRPEGRDLPGPATAVEEMGGEEVHGAGGDPEAVPPLENDPPTPEDETLPRCECGAFVERPCDQFCLPCFDAILKAI